MKAFYVLGVFYLEGKGTEVNWELYDNFVKKSMEDGYDEATLLIVLDLKEYNQEKQLLH